MPTRTGTAAQVNGSAGDGSTSVTVPADATCSVAFWAHWDGNGNSTLATLALGGNAFSTQAQLAEGATTDVNGVGVAYLGTLPGTGTQTLAWTWSAGGARSEGGEIVVVWVKDHNPSDPIRAAAVDADAGGSNVEVSFTTQADDLVVAFGQCYVTSTPVLVGSVFIDNATLNSHDYDVGEVTAASGATTVVSMTGEEYSSIAGIALKAAAGGGAEKQSFYAFRRRSVTR